MKMLDAIKTFFANPKWTSNLLFCALCVLVPIVGPIVLLGYLSELFDLRIQPAGGSAGLPGSSELNYQTPPATSYPDFSFDRLSVYLTRGIWPFLVVLVASVAVGIVVGIVFAIIGIILGLLVGLMHLPPAIMLVFNLLIFVVEIVLSLAITAAIIPLMIRAMITSDFAASFNLTWIKDFYRRVGSNLIIEVVLYSIGAAVVGTIGFFLCIIGILPAAALIYFAFIWIIADLYRLYLEKGGTPVTKPIPTAVPTTPPPPAPPAA